MSVLTSTVSTNISSSVLMHYLEMLVRLTVLGMDIYEGSVDLHLKWCLGTKDIVWG